MLTIISSSQKHDLLTSIGGSGLVPLDHVPGMVLLLYSYHVYINIIYNVHTFEMLFFTNVTLHQLLTTITSAPDSFMDLNSPLKPDSDIRIHYVRLHPED